MPLENGSSQAVIGRNIAREREAGKEEQQAIAIAESEARRTGRDMQVGMATAPNSSVPAGRVEGSRSVNDAWRGKIV